MSHQQVLRRHIQPSRWMYALKPASWPKILVPVLLGQALGAAHAGRMSWGAALFGLLFAVFDTAFIVLLNDGADEGVDRLKRRLFPNSGSQKTIPDGILPARSVWVAGGACGLCVAAVSFSAASLLDRPLLGPAGLTALAVFAAYSLPPVRLNYRGGGELLEAIGVGGVLPWINAYAQSGTVYTPLWSALGGFVALSLASAVASGLSDEESDRKGGKRTIVTSFGNRAGRRVVQLSAALGVVAWLMASWIGGGQVPWIATLPAALVVSLRLWQVQAVSASAVTNAFDAQKRYKAHLHRAIWDGTLVLAAGVCLAALV